MSTLTVSVVSADREVWSGQANQIIAKTVEGEIGILCGHEPVLAMLSHGKVRISTDTGEKVTVDAEGGFLSVDHDTVTIVAGKAEIIEKAEPPSHRSA